MLSDVGVIPEKQFAFRQAGGHVPAGGSDSDLKDDTFWSIYDPYVAFLGKLGLLC